MSYKRFDLAIQACESAGKRLIIAGSGPDEQTLRKIAGPENSFEIKPDSKRWRELIANAEALLFPGV